MHFWRKLFRCLVYLFHVQIYMFATAFYAQKIKEFNDAYGIGPNKYEYLVGNGTQFMGGIFGYEAYKYHIAFVAPQEELDMLTLYYLAYYVHLAGITLITLTYILRNVVEFFFNP